jgi:hypothetical protein
VGLYTSAYRKEDMSFFPLGEALAEHWWTIGDIRRDIGVDHLVQVCDKTDDGHAEPVGLSFLVQLKSISKPSKHQVRDDPSVIIYRFYVSDLIHWSREACAPVVLIVWDIKNRVGYWRLVSDVLEELDKSADWRSKTKVTIRFAKTKDTSRAGLNALRWALADEVLPILEARFGPVEMKLNFSVSLKDAEGRRVADELERFRTTGEPVRVPSKYITMEFSPWAQRLYGEIKPEYVDLGGGSPRLSSARIEIFSTEFAEPVVIPYVAFWQIRGGTHEVVASNRRQKLPIIIKVHQKLVDGDCRVAKMKYSVQMRWEAIGDTILEMRDNARIVLAFATGTRLRVIFKKTGRSDYPMPKIKMNESIDVLRARVDLLSTLVSIEHRLLSFGRIHVHIPSVSDADLATLQDVVELCGTGEITSVGNFGMTINPQRLNLAEIQELERRCERDPEDRSSWLHCNGVLRSEELDFFGVKIPLGDGNLLIKCGAVQLKQIAAAIQDGSTRTRIEAHNTTLVRAYTDWLPGGKYSGR